MAKYSWKDYIRQENVQDAIFVFICSVALLIYGLYNKFTGIPCEWKLSPYLFPVLLSVFGILLSISLFYDGKKALLSGAEPEFVKGDPQKLKKTAIYLVIFLLYYFLMPVLGFFIATTIFLASLFILLGEKKWWIILLLSVSSTAIIYILFGVLLHVRFP